MRCCVYVEYSCPGADSRCDAVDHQNTRIRLTDSVRFLLLLFRHITVCAVAQHCCKGDERFQWEMPSLVSSSSGIPEPIFKKNWTVDYVDGPTPHAKIWISRPKFSPKMIFAVFGLR